jgi:crotonobetainyl-CoA:carnitine CoA-transferase CaiB-like acyl-CoA transferase
MCADSVPTSATSFAPLADVRIVDLTSSLAGPWCTAILAALGADVVKVERPGAGDEARDWGPRFFPGGSVLFFAANPGKRSLALDLKTREGREALLRLVDRADVFTASLRPGAAERLGLGPDELRARNPGLIVCTVGAFGHTGPLAHQPGYDPLMQAAAGIVSVTGEPDRPGVRVGSSLVDLATGLWAAIGVLAALRDRDAAAAGTGRTVDVSLFESALSLLPYQLADVLAGAPPPGRHGTAFPLIVPYQVLPTRDGELMVAAGNDRLFSTLCGALGALELATDPRFDTNPLRVEHRTELIPLLEARTRERTTADLLSALEAAGVPAAPVRTLDEVAAHEQTHALGILQQLGDRTAVAPPLSLNGERVTFPGPPPLLGEHTAEVLREAGYSDAEIDALEAAGVVQRAPAR